MGEPFGGRNGGRWANGGRTGNGGRTNGGRNGGRTVTEEIHFGGRDVVVYVEDWRITFSNSSVIVEGSPGSKWTTFIKKMSGSGFRRGPKEL